MAAKKAANKTPRGAAKKKGAAGPAVSLASKRPKERGGAIASNRFDFQKNWTLCHLLELHEGKTDYAIVCDYHDDVVVIELGKISRDLHFTQIKTKERGHWTIAALVARSTTKKKGGNSILGKLYQHTINFGGRVGSLTLISNAAYDVKLAGGGASHTLARIAFDEFHDDPRSKVVSCMQAEHSLPAAPSFPAATHLQVTPLASGSHTEAATGILAAFLERLFPNGAPSPGALYRSLYDEIKRRSNCEGESTKLDDLIASKGLTRNGFTQLLDHTRASKSYAELWPLIATDLSHAGVAVHQRAPIASRAQRYWIERMDASNDSLQRLRDRVVEAYLVASRTPPADLRSILTRVASAVGTDALHDEPYLWAITLVELACDDHPKLQEAHSQPTNQAS